MPEQQSKVDILGGQLIKCLHHLISTVRIHQDNNQMVKDCVAQFGSIVTELSEGEEITIQIWRGRFHIQGEKLLFQKETFRVINEMLEFLAGRGIGGLSFYLASPRAVTENIVILVHLMDDAAKYDEPFEWLDQQIRKHGFGWVELSRKQAETVLDPEMKRKEKARHTYFQALNTVKEMAERASKGATGVRIARRVAQGIVDLVKEDSTLLLGLATIRDYDDYTYIHSVNVSLLATCLGRNIGLSQVYLEHLAVCGLFHDLGKVGISKEIILKQGKLSSEEWNEVRVHPLIGVRKILRLHAPHSLRSRIILGPFEHHLNPDLSGYPKTHFIKKISLMGKILRIVDVYEALTSERAYRPRAFTPNEALRRMWSEGEKSFDTLLLKSFINMMGIYPIGSVVELDSGEIGLVIDYPDEPDKAFPSIMLCKDDGSGGITRGETWNLSILAREGRSRKIVRDIQPSRLGIQPSQFFLQA